MHGLATILRVMPMRRARHRVAAVHRLFGRCCRATVERIRRESDHQQCQQHWFCEAHFSQVRRIQRPGQAKLLVFLLVCYSRGPFSPYSASFVTFTGDSLGEEPQAVVSTWNYSQLFRILISS